MRYQQLGSRPPEEIPVAGVTLRDLMHAKVDYDFVFTTFPSDRHDELLGRIKETDEIWIFRTPPWTWAAMGGVEGFVILREGLALFWVVITMN